MAKKKEKPTKKVSLSDKIKSSELKNKAHETRRGASQHKAIGEAQLKSKKKDPKQHIVGESSEKTTTGHKTTRGRNMTTDKIPFGKERTEHAKDLERKAKGYEARAQTLNPNASIYGVKRKKK